MTEMLAGGLCIIAGVGHVQLTRWERTRQRFLLRGAQIDDKDGHPVGLPSSGVIVALSYRSEAGSALMHEWPIASTMRGLEPLVCAWLLYAPGLQIRALCRRTPDWPVYRDVAGIYVGVLGARRAAVVGRIIGGHVGATAEATSWPALLRILDRVGRCAPTGTGGRH